MICPKCGEVNSSNFLFCGMCGTILDPARKATALTPQAPRAAESRPAQPATPPPVAPTPAPPRAATINQPVPAISGPSLLGLDTGSVDDLRDRAFSGLASYGQPDEPRRAGKEVLLTIVLLIALAGAGWWTYKNYIRVAGSHQATVKTSPSETTTPPENQAPTPSEKPAEKSDAQAAPATPENTSNDANATPASTTPVKSPAPQATKAAEHSVEKTPQPDTPAPTPVRHEVSATRIPASKPAPADPADALFRRGQGYLYGRNGTEDCTNALKYLKMAADQQHAKARSMMGTMYATGHCVPRDLPSSYRWFALALRVDPNNSVLEKDLSAVWNQMTPPERQLATRSQ